jgi:hypothetical protein
MYFIYQHSEKCNKMRGNPTTPTSHDLRMSWTLHPVRHAANSDGQEARSANFAEKVVL